MTLFNPDTTTHKFKVIPRYYDEITIVSNNTIELYNESTNTITVFENVSILSTDNGYVEYQIEFTVNEGESFQIKILDQDNKIMFRGKIFCTSKETQNYSING